MLVLLIPMFSEATEDKFKVITTFTVIADIAQNIAGNAAIV
ncbi:MAG: metal ABC transporter substrate-binding protein, partial [Pseudomonadota bacterium]|nr:metal ABC transporter substrate-binding protein [Pseudomonadota bacterium]